MLLRRCFRGRVVGRLHCLVMATAMIATCLLLLQDDLGNGAAAAAEPVHAASRSGLGEMLHNSGPTALVVLLVLAGSFGATAVWLRRARTVAPRV